jgi:hypothetical protein
MLMGSVTDGSPPPSGSSVLGPTGHDHVPTTSSGWHAGATHASSSTREMAPTLLLLATRFQCGCDEPGCHSQTKLRASCPIHIFINGSRGQQPLRGPNGWPLSAGRRFGERRPTATRVLRALRPGDRAPRSSSGGDACRAPAAARARRGRSTPINDQRNHLARPAVLAGVRLAMGERIDPANDSTSSRATLGRSTITKRWRCTAPAVSTMRTTHAIVELEHSDVRIVDALVMRI